MGQVNFFGQRMDMVGEQLACVRLLEAYWNLSSIRAYDDRRSSSATSRLVEIVFEHAVELAEGRFLIGDIRSSIKAAVRGRVACLVAKGCTDAEIQLDGLYVALERCADALEFARNLFSDVTNGLYERVSVELSGIDFIAPKSYLTFMQHFRSDASDTRDEAFRMSEENRRNLERDFEGFGSEFPESVSLHAVGFHDVNSRYAPYESIFSGLVTQALQCVLIYNTAEIVAEIRKIPLDTNLVEGEFSATSPILSRVLSAQKTFY